MDTATHMLSMALRDSKIINRGQTAKEEKQSQLKEQAEEEKKRVTRGQNIPRLWRGKPKKEGKSKKSNKIEDSIQEENTNNKPKEFVEKHDKRLALLSQVNNQDLESIQNERFKLIDEEMNEEKNQREKQKEEEEEEEMGFSDNNDTIVDEEEQKRINYEAKRVLPQRHVEIVDPEIVRRNIELIKKYKKIDDEEEEGFDTMKGNESESEYEYDYDTEEESDQDIIRPIFKLKEQRTTLKTKEQIEAEKKKEEERKEAELQKRVEESKRLATAFSIQIAEEGKKKEELLKNEHIDDDNDEDLDAEFEKWREREISRLKRDLLKKEERIANENEKKHRSQLTDAEILAEDQKNHPELFNKTHGHMKYLQKYYHKGAFYQDGTVINDNKHILERDYTAPTGIDKLNRSALPEIYQVRDFGKKSRSKWTTMSKEDTTSKQDDIINIRDTLLQKKSYN